MATTITLPKPCTENWQTMTPTEQGRFCQTCQQTVIDFSGMTDAELLAFLKQWSGQALCGRLRTDQLNRPLGFEKPIRPTQWQWLSLLVSG